MALVRVLGPQTVTPVDTPATPLFIIGTERSGSNLLRLILNAHSGIAVPHPPHILKFFAPLLPLYGDLKRPAAQRRLAHDILSLLEAHIHPWEITVAPERLEPTHRKPPEDGLGPLVEVFFALYDEYRRQSGKRRWGCKSTFVIDYVEEVLAACPQAKFILLVRDPRDVAVSSRRSIFSPFHPYFTALLWRRQQLAGVRWLDSEAGGQFHLLRYEDLIEHPAETVASLCRFLDEEFEPQMLEYHATPEARKSQALSASWRNLGLPIKRHNRNTFQTDLTAGETRLVEAVGGELLTRFGYPLKFPAAPPWPASRPSALRVAWYQALDWAWRLAGEWRAFRNDRNYRLHWRRRIFLGRLRLRLRCRLDKAVRALTI